MASNGPIAFLEQSPMTARQKWLVVAGLLFNALIGFVSSTYAMASWLMMPTFAQGTSMSAVSAMMTTLQNLGQLGGALAFGLAADRWGRRPVLLAVLVCMAAGTLLSLAAGGMNLLFTARLLLAASTGGLAVVAMVLVADCVNAASRAFCVVLVGSGNVLGAMLGSGLMASLLNSPESHWQIGFTTTLLLILLFAGLTWLLVPESPVWLALGKTRDSLSRLNRALAGLGHEPVRDLPLQAPAATALKALPGYWPWLVAYGLQVASYYLLLRGVISNLATQMPGQAFGSLMGWVGLGGLVSGIVFLLLLLKVEVVKLTLPVVIMGGLLFMIAGFNPDALVTQRWLMLPLGVFSNMALTGLQTIAVIRLAAGVRGTGAGLVMMLGPLLILVVPAIAPVLMATAVGYQGIWFLMGAGSLLAAWLLRRAEKA